MSTRNEHGLKTGDALLVVDVQNDFCPGGALAIEEGDEVVPVLNHWLAAAAKAGIPVFASRDWHPAGHISFESRGGPWPPHCLQDSEGARFHPELQLPEDVIKVTKGVRFDQDQYSAFDQTGLADELAARDVSRVWVGGLALDVCVQATAREARSHGFEVMLIESATRPVSAADGEAAIRRLREKGVEVLADE